MPQMSCFCTSGTNRKPDNVITNKRLTCTQKIKPKILRIS